MTNDPQGTDQVKAPSNAEGKKVINIKCRNPKCSSITAVEIAIPGTDGGQRLYQCTECGRPLPVNVGGAVNL